MNSEEYLLTVGKNHYQGKLFIISAPSGAGKTTLCRMLLNHFQNLLYSISFTTRKPRKGETNGKDYHFISETDFIKGIENNKWAEWAKVYDNYYGTSAEFIKTNLEKGKNILLDIDVQGAMQILKKYSDSITIFIMPPSLEALRERIKDRGTENITTIEKRMAIAEDEINKKDLYKHIIINDDLNIAASELILLVKSYGKL
jgi:guanylate kinase